MRAKFRVIGMWLVLALIGIAAPASAQSSRTFVSGLGSDRGACTLTAPCRSFAYAITQTNAGGEIVVQDSAGYGPLTITQSVTITSPGGIEAGITTTGFEDAITINTTSAAIVTLRGLTLEGVGTGAYGISLVSDLPANNAGGSLNVIDCVVKDFIGSGLYVGPRQVGNSVIPNFGVVISNSLFLNNIGAGIKMGSPTGVSIYAYIYNSITNSNATGIDLSTGNGFITATFVKSHADNNSSTGILVGPLATLLMKNSTAYAALGSDIVSTGHVVLDNDNTIGTLQNSGQGYTDGTNNVVVSGNSLQKVNPQ